MWRSNPVELKHGNEAATRGVMLVCCNRLETERNSPFGAGAMKGWPERMNGFSRRRIGHGHSRFTMDRALHGG